MHTARIPGETKINRPPPARLGAKVYACNYHQKRLAKAEARSFRRLPLTRARDYVRATSSTGTAALNYPTYILILIAYTRRVERYLDYLSIYCLDKNQNFNFLCRPDK